MANNIEKYYKYPERDYNKNIKGRYDYVCVRLKLHKDGIDFDDDLEWNIKDAVVGEINISTAAMNILRSNWNDVRPTGVRDEVLQEICDKGSYKIVDDNGELRCKGLEIYKICNSWNSDKTHKKLRFEHVIPYNNYSQRMIALYKKGALGLNVFRTMMERIHVCIVLKNECDRLDKQYKRSMPDGWKWSNDPWARYNACGIDIWKP